jgi:hypothetical protein
MMNKKCCICGSTENLSYCSLCKEYFCEVCETKYPERVAAAMEKAFEKFRQKIAQLINSNSD